MKKKAFIFIGLAIFITASILFSYKERYHKHNGNIFGTYYNIKYKSNRKLNTEILVLFARINYSLSTYDDNSIISKVNKNLPVKLDSHFIHVFNAASKIYNQTNGAFDITVAPIVNAWGFGSGSQQEINPNLIDSLLNFVGMDKISLENNIIKKKKSNIQLDVSAIAKGYAVDVIVEMFEKNKITNYLVEIGGELRVKGRNNKNNLWTVGIDLPMDNVFTKERELYKILEISSGALATSGNYRQFYYKDGKKYSHTIDPNTGYPVQHNLLSATVWSENCIMADAFATAFMVMGVEKSIALQKKMNSLEFFLIYQDESGNLKSVISDGFKSFLKKND